MVKGREKAEPEDGSALHKAALPGHFCRPPVIGLVNGFRDEDHR